MNGIFKSGWSYKQTALMTDKTSYNLQSVKVSTDIVSHSLAPLTAVTDTV